MTISDEEVKTVIDILELNLKRPPYGDVCWFSSEGWRIEQKEYKNWFTIWQEQPVIVKSFSSKEELLNSLSPDDREKILLDCRNCVDKPRIKSDKGYDIETCLWIPSDNTLLGEGTTHIYTEMTLENCIRMLDDQTIENIKRKDALIVNGIPRYRTELTVSWIGDYDGRINFDSKVENCFIADLYKQIDLLKSEIRELREMLDRPSDFGSNEAFKEIEKNMQKRKFVMLETSNVK